MNGGRLPRRIIFGNLEGAVRRGQGGKEKEWTDCVQSNIQAFGIPGDWKAIAHSIFPALTLSPFDPYSVKAGNVMYQERVDEDAFIVSSPLLVLRRIALCFRQLLI